MTSSRARRSRSSITTRRTARNPSRCSTRSPPSDGFEVAQDPVTPPGQTQESQWLQIRQAKPDYVILWGFGVMSIRSRSRRRPRLGYPARQDPRRLVGRLGRGRDPRRRRREGLCQRGVLGVRHQLPGDAGHQEEGLRRRQGQPRGPIAARHRSIYTRGVIVRDHRSSRRSARRRPSSARARS